MSSNIRIDKIYQFCGIEFIARTSVTQYCSDNCAKRAYKKRKRDEKLLEAKKIAREPVDFHPESGKRQFLSITDTARLLGVSRWTINRMLVDGRLNSVKFGNRRIISRQDIDKLFNL